MTRFTFALCMLSGLLLTAATTTEAQAKEPGVFRMHHGAQQCQCQACRQRAYGRPDLFAQYYTQGPCNQANAPLYVAPNTTIPSYVGHTYYTYQPLMPHEMLYKHQRSYYRYYNDGRGLTRTSVRWW